MRFGSVCSGIEAASVAWNPLGWRAAWLSEIEPFPAAVLAHHYPDVPNLGDMTTLPARIASGEVDAPDVFCGGTPCQAFSVAGLRKSLDDARGNLSLTFCEIANEIDAARSIRGEQPAIVFWENVPGVLNTKDNAFGCFLAGLAGEDDPLIAPGGKWTNAGCVFGPKRTVAWRVLDAQYFGVAQRRRRVFVVASARDGFDPAKVLFEFDSVRRDIAPSREARKGATASSTSRAGVGSQQQHYACGGIGSYHSSSASATLLKTGQDLVPGCETIITMAHGQGGAEIATDRSPTLTCNHEAPIAAYGIPGNWIGRKPENGGNAVEPMHNAAPCLTSTDRHGVAVGADCYNGSLTGDVACTMGTAGSSVNASGPTVMVPTVFQPGNLARGSGPSPSGEVFGTLISSHGRGSTDQFPHVAIPLAFPANLSGTQCANSENLSPTLGSMGHDGGHANGGGQVAVAFAIQAGALRTNPASGPDGVGVQADHAYTLEARAEVQAVAFAQNQLGEVRSGEVFNTPNTNSNASGRNTPMVATVAAPVEHEALYNKGFNHGGNYASTQETHTGKILRALREAVGEEAFAKWGLGILDSLQSPEILRQALHGVSIRPAAFSRSWVVHCALSRQEDGPGWLLQSLRETGCEGCPPQGWEPPEQLNGELRAYLQELSQPGAQASRFMRDLWWAAQGPGLLREALSAVQEMGRPTHGQSQPAHGGMQVRRLTVDECEFLQGFPRGYTAIPWRKKPASDCPDGPRYKALGNSWAAPVVRWIGQRISDELARIQAERPAANDPQVNRHALF